MIPRHSVEIEMAVLGGLMLAGPAKWPSLRKSLSEDSFYRPVHMRIFGVLKRLLESGKDADFVTVPTVVSEAELEAMGGVLYLVECCESIASVSQLPGYVQILSDLAAFRRYREFFAQGARFCDDPASEPAELSRMVTTAVREIEAGRPVTFECRRVGDILETLSPKVEPGEPTGVERFDRSNIHKGLARGEPTYVGAETGVGKTVLGCQIAAHVAGKGGTVLFASLEIPERRVTRRILGQLSGCQSEFDAHQYGRQADWDRAVGEMRFWDLAVYDPAVMPPGADSIEAFVDHAQRTHDKIPWSLIVVDYAQLFSVRKSVYSDVSKHEYVSSELRTMAKRTGTAVLVLAQANRDVTDKGRLRLRNSKEYENGANAVILIDRRKHDGKEQTWLVADKNRDGERFKLEVELTRPHGRFEPVETTTEAPWAGLE